MTARNNAKKQRQVIDAFIQLHVYVYTVNTNFMIYSISEEFQRFTANDSYLAMPSNVSCIQHFKQKLNAAKI